MFEKASQKQGLEQAVIRGIDKNGPKKSAKEQKLELERLLRHGAYDLFKDGEAESKSFNEQDIESILAARSTEVEQEAKGQSTNLMSTASFVPASAGADVDYNDPDFWTKLMPASVVAHHSTAHHGNEEQSLEYGRVRCRKGVERLGFVAGAHEGADKEGLSGSGSDSDSGFDNRGRGGGGGERADRVHRRDGKGGGGEGKDDFPGPQWGVGDMKVAKKKLLDFGYGRWSCIYKAAGAAG
jgi:hypothetical protein